ncbi:MAG: FHA domain-containing protein [Bdellovibrionales bacterium]|nr:FHA domain-containing protein [Bdellovibrionales bacterium]
MKLVILRGESKGREFPLEEGENLIGRWDPEAGAFPEVDLDEEDPEAKVSRKHAVIFNEGSRVELEDLDSRNGTFLNRERLDPGKRYSLSIGDEIIIGKTFLKVE